MKRILLVTFIFLLDFGVCYSQNIESLGASHPAAGNPPVQVKTARQVGNGNSTFGVSFNRENVCGLNYVQASQLVETRTKTFNWNNTGTGLPTSVTLSGLCSANDSIIKAYLYWCTSYNDGPANPAVVTITNPIPNTFTYNVDVIGMAGPKCWGEIGTAAYRGDVTSCISGNGAYTINISGAGDSAWEVDGLTLMVIYRDPTATYSASLILWDGIQTSDPGTPYTETFNGIDVCQATSNASAIAILSDMQGNENGGNNIETFNGTTVTYANDFWNFIDISTPFTTGQNSCTYNTYTNNAGTDCYSWIMAGAYWQNTTCVTCTPANSFVSITAPSSTICSGDSVLLIGGGANSFTWSPPAGLSCTSCDSTYANPTSTTIYTVTGTSACGTGTDTLTVHVLSTPSLTIAPANPEVCGGASVQLNVSGATSYSWTPAGGLSCTSCPDPVASPTATTTYTITATDACGTHDTTVTVSVFPVPIALATANRDSICSGDTVLLTAGGGGNYVWSTGATTSTIQVVPLITTTYTLHVFTTGSACQDSALVTIYVTQSITSAVSLSIDSICPGATTTLTVTSSGGTPSYIWNTGATTSSISVSPATTTTYYVLTEGPCANDSIGMVVTVIPFPDIIISSPDTVCKGSSVVVSASGATSYLWSNGSTTNPTTITVNSDTSISVIGTNGNCSNGLAKNLKVYPALVSTRYSDSVCSGTNATIHVSASGGHAPYTYSWNNGITSDSAGPLTVPVPPFQYICTITDDCGDVTNDTVNIGIRPGPALSFDPTPDTINGGGFVSFVNLSTGATSYYWTLGDGSTSTETGPFHQYVAAGTYLVTVIATNEYGCVDTLSKDVYVLEEIVIPNVFTPDENGTNSTFHITMGSMQAYDIQIYNRWGQKIFESQSPNIDWTGRSSSGELESSGTYYYIIKAADYTGKAYDFDGYVQLIR